MDRIGKIAFAATVAAVCILSSCGKTQDSAGGVNFETSSFNGFLWHKHVPDTVKAVINAEFSECAEIDDPLVLQLCDNDARAVGPEVAQLWVNGEKSADNTVKIMPHDGKSETEIWIVLNDAQTERTRTFTWELQIVDNPGLVKVNNRSPEEDPWLVNTTLNWRNVHVANPLKVWTESVGLALLVVLIAWIILVQFVIFPKFKVTQVKKIFLTIGDNRRNIQSFSSSVIGSKEIVLTGETKSQGYLAGLFCGRVTYVRVPGMRDKVVLTPGAGRYQSRCSYERKYYVSATVGEHDELKVIMPSGTESPSFSIEYYHKKN